MIESHQTPHNATRETRERRRERRKMFLRFFSVVFAIHGLINVYIFWRLNESIPSGTTFAQIFPWLFWVVALSYFVGQFMEHNIRSWISDVLTWIGAFWLGMMTWFFLGAVVIDLIRLLDWPLQFLPSAWYANGAETKATIATVTSSVIAVATIVAFFNARNIRVKPITIKIDKKREGGPLRIAMLSDMHMGTIIGRSMVRQMVEKINSIKPDIVLMAGDQMDGEPHPAMRMNLGKILEKIESTYGVFAITGNHEYIGNAETSCAYMESHGIRFLRDASVEVAGVQIVGREDYAAKQFAKVERKPLAELVAALDKSKPIILMDHTPFHLEDAEQNGVDLQVSGHTHHAQIWPWHLITKRVYEVSWGYKKKGNTHIYVSCGSGTWGPPIRIGNTPEIMAMTIEFT
jgi:predicted MPP superfamily phosphohydrolase